MTSLDNLGDKQQCLAVNGPVSYSQLRATRRLSERSYRRVATKKLELAHIIRRTRFRTGTDRALFLLRLSVDDVDFININDCREIRGRNRYTT